MKKLRNKLGAVRLSLNSILGRQPVRKDFSVREDDCLLAGYPKSGTTWLRFLVANLLYPEQQTDFASIEKFVPDPKLHGEPILKRLSSPRFFKSHEVFDPRFSRVVLIVRDPRDVVVSYHRFLVKMKVFPESFPRQEFVQRFVSGTLDGYGTWDENIGSWLGALGNQPKRLFWFRYEDLMATPVETITRLVQFLGLDSTEQAVRLAVERSSAREMRKLEKQTGHKWKPIRHSDRKIEFVGTARCNKWETLLEPDEVKIIEENWTERLRELGYQTSEKPSGNVKEYNVA